MTYDIQFRRGTAAEWTAANRVLLEGEVGYETDTQKFKIGDGSTAWNALGPYYTPAVTGADLNFEYAQLTAASTWVVAHYLGKRPSVTVIDSAGDEVEGYVVYDSADQLTLTFSAAFAGTAYLN